MLWGDVDAVGCDLPTEKGDVPVGCYRQDSVASWDSCALHAQEDDLRRG